MEREKKDELLVKIGEKIEKRRLEMNLSKHEFADLLKTSRAQLNRLIHGDVNSSIVRLKEICELTDMSLVDLVSL